MQVQAGRVCCASFMCEICFKVKFLKVAATGRLLPECRFSHQMALSSLMGLCRFFYDTVTHTAGSFFAHFAEMKTKAIFFEMGSSL